MNDLDETDALNAPNQRWGSRIIVVLFTLVFAPLALTLLCRYYDPHGTNSYFPGCYFKEWTSLNCPGCGSTRCLYALLHLDLAQALAYNPLFVLALPYLIFAVFCMLYTMWTGKLAPYGRMPGWATKCLFAIIVCYWILRNIDVYPLNLLAPHDLNIPG
jgi:hypothetical protein